MRKLLLVFLICLLLPIQALAVTYADVGATTNFDGDVGVPTGGGFYVNGVQVTSAILSDVASVAMLDEAEEVTGEWIFIGNPTIRTVSDTPGAPPLLSFQKRTVAGDVAQGDYIGKLNFYGYHGAGYQLGATIRGIVSAAPGDSTDMPTRLCFLTSPDEAAAPVLRFCIEEDGNIMMGDGVWTDYIQVTATGVLTPEGSATVKATNLVPTVEIDFGAHSVGFTLQTGTGDGTTTIDWTAGIKYQFTHGDMAETFTFDPAPTNPCNLILEILEDGNGAHDCTWPGAVTWLGAEPTWTDGAANKTIIVCFWYNGTTYWGQGTPWEE